MEKRDQQAGLGLKRNADSVRECPIESAPYLGDHLLKPASSLQQVKCFWRYSPIIPQIESEINTQDDQKTQAP
jgi:hypothetical protein